ncbi:MAG: PIN domain-containing protein [Actinomycetota bacterium]
MKPEDVRRGPVLVDTDVFSYVHTQRGPWEAFVPFIEHRTVAASFITVAELWLGARKRDWGDKKCKDLEVALGVYLQLAPDTRVAMLYADLAKACMGQLGGNREEHDLWIAATAIVFELPLVTNNLTDYQQIHRAGFADLVLVHPDI